MISAIGISTIDHLMVVENFINKEGTFYSESYSIEGGGMAATAMCAASKLGSKTKLFSRIGDDVNGQFILKGLTDFKVDTTGTVTVKNARSFTTLIFIESKSGEKQFWCEKKPVVFEKTLKLNIDLLKGTKVLLIDSFWMEAAQEAVLWASQNNIPIVADFNEYVTGIDKLFPYVNYLIVPSFFAISLTQKNTISDILHSLKKMINGIPVVTDGSKGGAYLPGDKVRNYKVYNVPCNDSTGAGDAFHGAFCHFLSLNYPLERCLDMASAVGALNCQAIGGRKGLPDNNLLMSFVNKSLLNNTG